MSKYFTMSYRGFLRSPCPAKFLAKAKPKRLNRAGVGEASTSSRTYHSKSLPRCFASGGNEVWKRRCKCYRRSQCVGLFPSFKTGELSRFGQLNLGTKGWSYPVNASATFPDLLKPYASHFHTSRPHGILGQCRNSKSKNSCPTMIYKRNLKMHALQH